MGGLRPHVLNSVHLGPPHVLSKESDTIPRQSHTDWIKAEPHHPAEMFSSRFLLGTGNAVPSPGSVS